MDTHSQAAVSREVYTDAAPQNQPARKEFDQTKVDPNGADAHRQSSWHKTRCVEAMKIAEKIDQGRLAVPKELVKGQSGSGDIASKRPVFTRSEHGEQGS
jgi:hypothetical protein